MNKHPKSPRKSSVEPHRVDDTKLPKSNSPKQLKGEVASTASAQKTETQQVDVAATEPAAVEAIDEMVADLQPAPETPEPETPDTGIPTDGAPATTQSPPADAAPATVSAPSDDEVEVSPPRQLERLRVDIADVIRDWFTPLFFLTSGVAVSLIVLTGTAVFTGRTVETMALAASVQVAFGMVVGFVCVYIGLMMTWFGLDAAYTISGKMGASSANGEISIKSASPGLIFALGGIVLICVALYKPIIYEETGGFPRHIETLGSASGNQSTAQKSESNPQQKSPDEGPNDTDITPNPPPPLGNR